MLGFTPIRFGGMNAAKEFEADAASRRVVIDSPCPPAGEISLPFPVPPLIREGAAEGGAGEQDHRTALDTGFFTVVGDKERAI